MLESVAVLPIFRFLDQIFCPKFYTKLKLKFQFREFDYFCQIHKFEIHEIRDSGI